MAQFFLSTGRFLAIAVAVLALALLIGCGSSGSDELTRQEFIQQADAICVKTTQEISKTGERYAATFKGTPTSADLAKYVSIAIVPNFEGEIAKLRKLGVPTEDEKLVNRVLSTLEAGLKEVKKDPDSFVSGVNDNLAEAAKLGQAYGFAHCGSLT